MKIEQQKVAFQPVTITLETADEVNAMWAILMSADYRQIPVSCEFLSRKIANYFTNELQGFIGSIENE